MTSTLTSGPRLAGDCGLVKVNVPMLPSTSEAWQSASTPKMESKSEGHSGMNSAVIL